MWIISGPFEGPLNANELRKSKLLKPGKTYALGRKDRPLVLNNRSISRDHLSLKVGVYTEEDVSNPDKKPTLELHNVGSKPRRIKRGDVNLIVNPQSSLELEDKDEVFALNDLPLTVEWRSVCCYLPTQDSSEVPYEGCAKLGVSLVLTPHPSITHHLIFTLTPSPQVAASLLTGANFIRPDWLTTLLERGITPISSSTTQIDTPSPFERLSKLEVNFTLPPIKDFKPDFSPIIPSAMRSVKVWEPNNARAKLFAGKRFIFVGEKGREVSLDLREVIKRGDAEYECWAVEGGRSGFHSVLAKGKGKGKPLVLVADEHAMGIAVGQDQWMEIVKEAADYGLHFIRPEKLIQAVMHVDLSYIDCALNEAVEDSLSDPNRFASSLPDVIPNTHVEEPSVLVTQEKVRERTKTPPPAPSPFQPPRRRPRRRGLRKDSDEDIEVADVQKDSIPNVPSLSREGQEAPEEQERPVPVNAEQPENKAAEEAPKVPRRRPVRRPVNRALVFGDEDDSLLQDGETSAAESNTTPVLASVQIPDKPPSSRTVPRRPKRRRIGETPLLGEDQDEFSVVQSAEEEEPPLKRYKALYEESDPDRIAQSGMEEYMNLYKSLDSTGSMTQSESMGVAGTRLEAVPEEEEGPSESAAVAPARAGEVQETTQRLKRMRVEGPEGDEDVEMMDINQQRTKRRAVEGVDAVETIAELETQTKAATSKKPVSKVFTNKTQSQRPTSKNGAAAGKPDKDEAFLKAVASTKGGKRREDEFDREFNNLKISKPDLRREQEETEWGVLEEFGDDGDVRGNFMVVVEMEVPSSREPSVARRYGEGRLEWDGRPDFKKFKKKAAGERRQPVELILSVEPEDAFSSQLYKDGQPQHNKDHLNATSVQIRKPPSLPRGSQRRPVVVDDDDDVVQPTQPKRSQRSRRDPSPVHIQVPPNRYRRQVKSKPIDSEPLFLESDEDMDIMENDDVAGNVVPSGGTSNVSQVEDDMDDEMTLRSSVPISIQRETRATRTSPRKKGVPATVIEDDSEDEVAFKGFGRRRK